MKMGGEDLHDFSRIGWSLERHQEGDLLHGELVHGNIFLQDLMNPFGKDESLTGSSSLSERGCGGLLDGHCLEDPFEGRIPY